MDRAEVFLRSEGFSQVRVRHHGETARIELIPKELPRAMNPVFRQTLVEGLKALGYHYVTLDLEGYRRGSLNETL